ncbi:Holliday junction resolvase RuvX [Gleimia sp. 6138-11-ORH1]|uniref:Holliday junction resolvase RuvX n=1 Tax=Gleimia sp. 6138-11-ORH1 TaxID=2973937 RepID=UPI00216943C7|nr:Holliday junction resolvase RuvX [Gleimia sp. 6138-11-ORH1]MCS4484392.1 Holliday junction resolvase RuvX [Gleimia sp. 6138-11-ORH1]
MAFRSGVRIGIDYGKSRIGIAVTDPSGKICFPHTTFKFSPYGTHIDEIIALAIEREAIEIVVGMPKHLSGVEGATAQSVREFAQELATELPELRVCLIDERLTTNQAHAGLATMGIENRKRKDKIDQLAAAIILENALQTELVTGNPPGEQVE